MVRKEIAMFSTKDIPRIGAMQGMVILRMRCIRVAPSMAAASTISPLILAMADMRRIEPKPKLCQMPMKV